MKTHLYLVRHAQSAAMERGIVQGRGFDIPLSAEGKRQAVAVADVLRTEHFDHIYTSTAVRAIETARAIRTYHPNVLYEEIPELIERSKGIAEGVNRDEFHLRWPEIQTEWDQELDARPPEGENFEDVHSRIVPVIERHLHEHGPGKTLLYVLHGNVNRVLLGYMLGIPYRLQPRIEQGYCAINIANFDHVKGRWHVKCVNRVPEA
jgi:broad specificity phosphatase PhoE